MKKNVERRYPVGSWRGMTPIDPCSGVSHLSFDLANESSPVRMLISVASLRQLSGVLDEYLSDYDRRGNVSQSESSDGSPMTDVSTPGGLEKQ